MTRPRLARKYKFAIFILGGLICAAMLNVLSINWPLVRASYFTDPSTFATTTGTISSTRTGVGHGRYSDYYYYIIWYDYEVDRTSCRSSQVTFNPSGFNDPSVPQSYVEKYPVGRHVTVYYDRGDPTFSVLEPNTRYELSQVVFLALLALLAAGACVWGLLAFLRDRPRA